MEQLGKYQLIRKLATGGMAEVFLARAAGPMGFQKTVVVKRILPHFADDPQFIDMFLAEARIAAELNHPNIVHIFDFGQEGKTFYIAMEYIDGPNLRELYRRLRNQGLSLSLGHCAKIISAACDGLGYAHDFRSPETGQPVQLIHRDVSPDNILLARNGTVKVVDFGIAKASNQPHLTKSGVVKGKMAYMPPEQLARKPMDLRVDVFALGVVFYQLVSGMMPFDATSEVSIIQALMSADPLMPIRERRADVPAELERIIARALEKVPEDRYPSCKALQADIERFLHSTGEAVLPHELAGLLARLEEAEAKAGVAGGNAAVGAFTAEAQRAASRAETRDTATPALPGSGDGEEELGETYVRLPEAAAPLPLSQVTTEPLGDTWVRPVSEVAPLAGTGAGPDAPAGLIEKELGQSVRRSKAPMIAVLGGAAVLLLGGGYLALSGRSRPPEPAPVAAPVAAAPVEPPRPVAAAPVVPPVAPIAPATPAPVLAANPEAPPESPEPATRKPAEKPAPSHAKSLQLLEFRIRPYAEVYLDGRSLGQTPFRAVSVPAGKHSIRMVNPGLGKDVTVDFKVKAGQDNVFKYNLKE